MTWWFVAVETGTVEGGSSLWPQNAIETPETNEARGEVLVEF